MAELLPQFGWDPLVLTVQPENIINTLSGNLPGSAVIRTADYNLLTILKKKSGCCLQTPRRIASSDISDFDLAGFSFRSFARKTMFYLIQQFLFFPDPHKGWLKIAVSHVDKIKKQPIDLIFSSSSPVTCHYVAKHYQSILKKPWVADFRDLWTLNHIYSRIFPLNLIERRQEKRIIGSADAITTVSAPLAEKMSSFHQKEAVVIMNGYDALCEKTQKKSDTKTLTIRYTGKVYQGFQDYEKLFIAMSELSMEFPKFRNIIRFEFFGRNQQVILDSAQKNGVDDLVHFYPQIEYDEIVKIQRSADCLLLFGWKDQRERGILTGKLFDYLGAGRFIIGIGQPHDQIAEILKDTLAGCFLITVEEIKKKIKELILCKKSQGFIPIKRHENLEKYSRFEQTKKLAQLFDRLHNKSASTE
jgi:hypothetical protein